MKLFITIALLSGLTLADRSAHKQRAEDPLYYIGYCQDTLVSVGGVVDIGENQSTKTATACNQLGGESCERGCVIAGNKETPNLTRASWKEACRAAGAGDDELIRQDFVTREVVRNLAGC